MTSENERTGLEGHKLRYFLMCKKENCLEVKNDVMELTWEGGP